MRETTVLSHRQRAALIRNALKAINHCQNSVAPSQDELRKLLDQYVEVFRQDSTDFQSEPWLKRIWDRSYHQFSFAADVLAETGIPAKIRRGERLQEMDYQTFMKGVSIARAKKTH